MMENSETVRSLLDAAVCDRKFAEKVINYLVKKLKPDDLQRLRLAVETGGGKETCCVHLPISQRSATACVSDTMYR